MKHLPPNLLLLADSQAGALTTRSLAAAGFRSRAIDVRVNAGLWQRPSCNVVVLRHGPTDRATDLWVAALHFDGFVLGGASALEVRGLPAPHDRRIHIVGRRGGWGSRRPGWSVHSTQEPLPRNAAPGPPRVDDITAAVQAMRWATTLRQAVFHAVWAIQHKLVRFEELQSAVCELPVSPTRAMAVRAMQLIDPGVHSMNEFDFARECRRRGLPEPIRQARRTDSTGTPRFLDTEFRVNGHSLVVEIDGWQHLDADMNIEDAFRANEMTSSESRLLRIPGLALRVDADRFYDQLQRNLRELAAA